MTFLRKIFSKTDSPDSSSNRAFGIVFFFVFMGIALWPTLEGGTIQLPYLIIGLTFLVLAFIIPAWLSPLNRLWLKFGALVHMIASPFAMGVLYYGIITPVGLFLRLKGRDILHLRFDETEASYWKRRDPPGTGKDSLDRQF